MRTDGALERERRAGRPGDRDQPAPVRIAAVNRGLDERRVGDRPRRQPRVVVRCARPMTRTVTSLVAPSPPRTMPIASGSQAAVQRCRRAAASRSRSASTPVAPFASAKTQSLVEHSPSTVMALKVSSTDRLERALQQRRLDRRVGRHERRASSPSAARSSRSPWPCRRRGTLRPSRVDFDRRLLRERIGRHDRARGAGAAVGRQLRRPRRRCRAATLSIVELHADDAGRRDEHVPARRSRRRAAVAAAIACA